MGSISTFQLKSHSFEEMKESLSRWDHEYHQMGPGPFTGSIFHVQADDFSIFRNRWERKIHYQGTTPRGTLAIAITLHQNGEARWLGEKVTEDNIFIQRPDREADYMSGSLWDSIVITIPTALLARHFSELNQPDPDEILPHLHGVLPSNAEQVSTIRNAVRAYLDAIQFATGEKELTPIAEMTDFIVELIARQLIDSRKPSSFHRTHYHHTHLIRQAETYCIDHVEQPLRIGQLCRDLHVSERTLLHVFRRHFDLSPLEYLKAWKLNMVYKILRRSEPGKVLIKQVAYDHGFFHLGQFSRAYQRLFGALPSHTFRFE